MNFVHRGSGQPPLLFVHGFGCAAEDWHAQLDHFAPRHEVVACDLRGHGATPGRPAECSIEHYGGDVAALLNHLSLRRAILVGHSMGTRVVLEAARISPEPIGGLVLIDGSRQGSGNPQDAAAAVRAAIDAVGFAAFRETVFRQMFFDCSPLAERLLARSRLLPPETGYALWLSMVRWDAAHMAAVLAGLRAPLMVIQSTYIDAAGNRAPLKTSQSSPFLDFIRAHVPGARIEVLPAVGHFSQIEAAGAVNRLIGHFVQFAMASSEARR